MHENKFGMNDFMIFDFPGYKSMAIQISRIDKCLTEMRRTNLTNLSINSVWGWSNLFPAQAFRQLHSTRMLQGLRIYCNPLADITDLLGAGDRYGCYRFGGYIQQ
jgi:hypothetical protein